MQATNFMLQKPDLDSKLYTKKVTRRIKVNKYNYCYTCVPDGFSIKCLSDFHLSLFSSYFTNVVMDLLKWTQIKLQLICVLLHLFYSQTRAFTFSSLILWEKSPAVAYRSLSTAKLWYNSDNNPPSPKISRPSKKFLQKYIIFLNAFIPYLLCF